MAWEWIRQIWGPEQLYEAAEGTVYDMTPKPKPRLAVVNNAPSRDEFAAWRDDPTTLFVFAALRAAAAEQKQAWDEVSWHGGEANAPLLTELRTRADAYEALEAGGYDAFCEWAGVVPEPIMEGDDAA